MSDAKGKSRGRPKKAKAFKKHGTSLWMKKEMIDRLDAIKEDRGLSSRGDIIRMMIESHPEYREARS
jgi:metal-responsive CopG/Arc/MetJ family transcriptional regulator